MPAAWHANNAAQNGEGRIRAARAAAADLYAGTTSLKGQWTTGREGEAAARTRVR